MKKSIITLALAASLAISAGVQAQTIKGPDGGSIHFDIDPSRKQVLLEGLDDIAGTLKSDPAIASFEGKWWENGAEDAPAMNRLSPSLWSPAGQPAYNEVFVTVTPA